MRRAAAASLTALGLLAACASRTEERPTVASALEAAPLRRLGGQTLEVQLGGRQPATGGCDRLAGEQVRIRDGGLTITVPDRGQPTLPAGTTRIVRGTAAAYVVAPDGAATAVLDRALASGDEDDVAAFVGVDIGRSSAVAAVRAVTRLAQALDDAGVYAAVIHGPAGPPDEPGEDPAWRAAGVTLGGLLVTVQAAAGGPVDVTSIPVTDPCAYRAS